MKKISTFDDWIEYFKQWQKDIGYDADTSRRLNFETKLGELHRPISSLAITKAKRSGSASVKSPINRSATR